MADIEAVRAKWRQILQTSDDETVQARAHEVLQQLADPARVAKYQATVEKTDELKAEPDPTSFGEIVGAVGKNFADRGKAIGRGVAAVAAHPIDTFAVPERRREFERGIDDAVTLGYGRQLADYASRKVFGSADPTYAETEASDKAAAPDVRAGGSVLGIFLPSPVSKGLGAASKAASKVIPAGETVMGEAVRGAGRALGTYEATAPAMSALEAGGGSLKDRASRALDTATDPVGMGMAAGIGGAASGTGKVLSGAPVRAEESEIGAFREGVQNKTRVGKFVPNETQIRAALKEAPEVRAAAKTDPVSAAKMADEKFQQVSNERLQPFYEQMAQNGTDQIPFDLVKRNLEAAKAGFHKIAEKGQRAAIDDMIGDFEATAQENGGTVPAQFVREAATKYQGQGFANAPMFAQTTLAKQMKQAVGGALRSAIADHVESLAGDTPTGKTLRAAFRSANQDVAAWARITEILDEKADRVSGHAPAAADAVKAISDVAKHPLKMAAKAAFSYVPPMADAMDRRVLAPMVSSRLGQSVAPLARSAANAAPRLASPLPGFIPEIEQAVADWQRRRQQENQ